MRSDQHALSEMNVSRLLVFAGPALWALLVLFHPMPAGDSAYGGIRDDVDRWLVVHVGQLILTPFLFLAVWRLLKGLPSIPAAVSRCALVVWTVFFSAYDSIQGIATGVLTDHANGLAGEEQAGIARAVDFIVEDSFLAGDVSVLGLVAGGSWLIVAIAAAVALHGAGAGRAVVAAACVSSVFALHVVPAALGLVALVVAGVLRERQQTNERLPVTGSPPSPGAPTWGTHAVGGERGARS